MYIEIEYQIFEYIYIYARMKCHHTKLYINIYYSYTNLLRQHRVSEQPSMSRQQSMSLARMSSNKPKQKQHGYNMSQGQRNSTFTSPSSTSPSSPSTMLCALLGSSYIKVRKKRNGRIDSKTAVPLQLALNRCYELANEQTNQTKQCSYIHTIQHHTNIKW